MKNIKSYNEFINEGLSSEMTEEMKSIKDKAKKQGVFLKAPNGKKSKLNEKQWLMVRTKEFMEWFGDWQNDKENSSKVLDENEEPLVLYHGSTKKFDKFDNNAIGSTTGDYSGFYFTNNRGIAKGYYSKETGKGWGNLLVALGLGRLGGYHSTVYSVFLNSRNPYIYDFKGDFDNIGREKLISKARKSKYDLVILKNIKDGPSVKQDVYVVFESDQIKICEK